MKKISSIIILFISLITFVACQAPKTEEPTTEVPTQESVIEAKWKDGTYTATFDHTDGHGWRPKLEIVIFEGSIKSAWLDYVNPNGGLKSTNEDYGKLMKSKSGTTPTQAYEELNRKVVETQNNDIDELTGATHSLEWFHKLSDPLLKQAETGDTAELVLPMNDTYKASQDDFDKHGWKATISIEILNGEIVEVNYYEVNEKDIKKTEDEEYNEQYSDETNLKLVDAYNQLENQLIDKQDVSSIDAVSGATHASEYFIDLTKKALNKRVPY